MAEKTDRATEILQQAGFPEIANYETMQRADSRMLQYHARQIAYAEERVREELKQISDRVERARHQLDAGYVMNNLGVIQGSALDVDRAVAVLEERRETWSMLTATVQAAREAEGYEPSKG